MVLALPPSSCARQGGPQAASGGMAQTGQEVVTSGAAAQKSGQPVVSNGGTKPSAKMIGMLAVPNMPGTPIAWKEQERQKPAESGSSEGYRTGVAIQQQAVPANNGLPATQMPQTAQVRDRASSEESTSSIDPQISLESLLEKIMNDTSLRDPQSSQEQEGKYYSQHNTQLRILRAAHRRNYANLSTEGSQQTETPRKKVNKRSHAYRCYRGCPQPLRDEAALRAHHQKVHNCFDGDKYAKECTFCGKKFATMREYDVHEKRENGCQWNAYRYATMLRPEKKQKRADTWGYKADGPISPYLSVSIDGNGDLLEYDIDPASGERVLPPLPDFCLELIAVEKAMQEHAHRAADPGAYSPKKSAKTTGSMRNPIMVHQFNGTTDDPVVVPESNGTTNDPIMLE